MQRMRLIILAICLLATLCFVGCNSKPTEAPKPKATNSNIDPRTGRALPPKVAPPKNDIPAYKQHEEYLKTHPEAATTQ